jgi:hypothetical protein
MLYRSTSAELDYLGVELVAIQAVGTALESLEDPEARLRVLRWATERYQLESTIPSAVVASAVVVPSLVTAAPVLRLASASAPDAPVLRLASAPEHEAPVLRLAPPPEAAGFEPEFEPHVGLALDLELEPLQPAPELDLSVDNLEDLFEPALDPSPALVEEEGMLLGDADEVSALNDVSGLDDLSDLYECEPPSAEMYDAPMELCELPAEPARPQLHLVTREDQPFEQLIDDLVDNLQRLSEECLDA